MISSIRSGILVQVARRSAAHVSAMMRLNSGLSEGDRLGPENTRDRPVRQNFRTFMLCVKFSLILLSLAANKKQYHDEQNVACTYPHTSISLSILLNLTVANDSNIFSNNCLFESYWCLSLRTVNSVSFGLGRQPFRRRTDDSRSFKSWLVTGITVPAGTPLWVSPLCGYADYDGQPVCDHFLSSRISVLHASTPRDAIDM
jgi:hypothetical protein